MFSFWNILKAILIGFPTGFVASIPLGPSGLESVNRSISNGFNSGFKVSLGSVFADFIYLTIINLGLFNMLSNHHNLESLFWILSGVILLLFNRLSCKTVNSNSKFQKILYRYTSNGFLVGFLITFLNPTTPSLWIALSGTVLSIWRLHGRMFFIFSVSSMILGSIAWFCLLNILASKGFRTLKSDYANITSKLLNYFLLGLAIIFIIFGTYKFIF